MREFKLVYRVNAGRSDGEIIDLAIVRFRDRDVEIDARHYIAPDDIDKFDIIAQEVLFDDTLPKIHSFINGYISDVYWRLLNPKLKTDPEATVSSDEVIEHLLDDLKWSIYFYELSPAWS